MKKIFVLIIIGLQLTTISGQTSAVSGQSVVKNEDANVLSGSLNIDSKIAFDNSEKIITPVLSNIEEQKKSVWLAVGLSAVIPGAGEFYSESYIKSAAFIAIEATAITLGLIYDKKGNDQTDFFQNYADQHWSVDRYAKWTVNNASSINNEITDVTQYKVFNSSGSVNWSELNRLENAIGKFYSHRLPYYGGQQYFELIGKYQQFYQGWDDADPNLKTYEQIVQKLADGGANFDYYSLERGKANDFYNIASKAVLVVVVNHIVSALDAAWTAHSYNKNLDMHASIERRDYGFITVYYPQLNLQYRF